MNREKNLYFFRIGQLVDLFQPRGSILRSGYRKCSVDFVGLLVIFKCVSPNQFIYMYSNYAYAYHHQVILGANIYSFVKIVDS